jgi:branched-chain amino acid transport system substrate-binding protein
MVQQLGAKRIAIIHDTHVYGKGIAELTRQSLDELGTPPVLFEALQPGQLVFADLIQRMRGAEIDVVSYGGYPPSVGLLRRQMAEASFLPTLIASTANGSEEYYLIAGEAAEGTLVVADQRFNTAEFAQFEESLRAAYHMDSHVRNTRGYASIHLWAQAVEAAGTTDDSAVAQGAALWDVSRLRDRSQLPRQWQRAGPAGRIRPLDLARRQARAAATGFFRPK